MHSKAIRLHAFNGTPQMRLQRALAEVRSPLSSINPQLWFYGGICAGLLMLSGFGWQSLELSGNGETRSLAPAVKSPMVRNEEWRSMAISVSQPESLGQASATSLQFRYASMLPVAK